MDEKNKIKEVLNNLSDSTNKELLFCLNYLNDEFEKTKKSIVSLTNYLDNTEKVYNKILKEYKLFLKILKKNSLTSRLTSQSN